MNLVTGTKLGPYAIVARIGAGGMGKVYRALDTRLLHTFDALVRRVPRGGTDGALAAD
jgi:serine/threonine protein kinase